jgi:pimeloyl-ACP methyl ester carboxylesterase
LGFGESLFDRHGIDCLYVKCSTNAWWQYPELPEALGALSERLNSWSEVVTYGSSMGGYAAFRFAANLHAKRALAFAPQFSINRKIAPLETRWGNEHKLINYIHEDFCFVRDECEYIAVYDPFFTLDHKQVALFKRAFRVLDVHTHFAGHPPTEILNQYGVLSEFTLAALKGEINLPALRAIQRKRRRASPQYWRALARRMSERRSWAVMEHASEQLVSTSPDRGGALRYRDDLRQLVPSGQTF